MSSFSFDEYVQIRDESVREWDSQKKKLATEWNLVLMMISIMALAAVKIL